MRHRINVIIIFILITAAILSIIVIFRNYYMKYFNPSRNIRQTIFFDAGKPCTSSSQCTGSCMADIKQLSKEYPGIDFTKPWELVNVKEFRCSTGCKGYCSKNKSHIFGPNWLEVDNGVVKQGVLGETPLEIESFVNL